MGNIPKQKAAKALGIIPNDVSSGLTIIFLFLSKVYWEIIYKQ